MICALVAVERNTRSAAGNRNIKSVAENNGMNFEKASNKTESEKKFEPNFELGNFNDIESSINFFVVMNVSNFHVGLGN